MTEGGDSEDWIARHVDAIREAAPPGAEALADAVADAFRELARRVPREETWVVGWKNIAKFLRIEESTAREHRDEIPHREYFGRIISYESELRECRDRMAIPALMAKAFRISAARRAARSSASQRPASSTTAKHRKKA